LLGHLLARVEMTTTTNLTTSLWHLLHHLEELNPLHHLPISVGGPWRLRWPAHPDTPSQELDRQALHVFKSRRQFR
jgi:hypothetical protein